MVVRETTDQFQRRNRYVSASVTGNVSMLSKGLIDGKEAVVLRDTGCSGVIVNEGLVDKKYVACHNQQCVLADGTQIDIPLADVEIDTAY